MVLSKTQLFKKDLQICAIYFKTLSHPARLAILKYLAETKNCITGDISSEIPLSRTTVNQHLKELEKSGLIKSHKKGVKQYFCLDNKRLKELSKMTNEYLKVINLPDNFSCKKKSQNCIIQK